MVTEKLDTNIRQEQIVQAALSIIGVNGIKGLKVVEIARQVGVVPSAIYRHFNSKDQILDAVLDFIQEKLLGNVQAVRQETSSSLERLRRLLERHIQLIVKNEAIIRLVFSEEIFGGHAARKAKLFSIIKSYLNEVGRIIEEGQTEGRIRRDIEPDTAALMFLGLIQPAAIIWHISDGALDIVDHTKKAWEIFAEAIRFDLYLTLEKLLAGGCSMKKTDIFTDGKFKDVGYGKLLIHDSPYFRIINFNFKPGQELPIHSHEVEGDLSILILEGEGEFLGQDAAIEAKAGDILTCAIAEPHGVRAKTQMRVIVTIAPPL